MLNKILRFIAGLLIVAGIVLYNNSQVEKRAQAECRLALAMIREKESQIEQKEVQNVEIKKSVIYSRPNAGRDSLLNKMRTGQL